MCICVRYYTNEATKYGFVLIWVSTQIKSWLSWARFSIIFHTFSVWLSGWYYLLTSCQLASHDCTHISFEIWGTCGSEYENYHLRYETLWCNRSLWVFWKNMLPPFSGWKNCLSMKRWWRDVRKGRMRTRWHKENSVKDYWSFKGSLFPKAKKVEEMIIWVNAGSCLHVIFPDSFLSQAFVPHETDVDMASLLLLSAVFFMLVYSFIL